jgi:hypothetical protein
MSYPKGYSGIAEDDLAALSEAEGLLQGLSSQDDRRDCTPRLMSIVWLSFALVLQLVLPCRWVTFMPHRSFFIGLGQLQDSCFLPVWPCDLQADWQARFSEAAGN